MYYKFHGSVRKHLQVQVVIAMRKIEKASCIKFEPRKTQRNFLLIKMGDRACYSLVGMKERGQVLMLGTQRGECFTKSLGTVQHELLHSLGIIHEQSRADRDNFVSINHRNIKPHAKNNFGTYHDNHFGQEYDYASIMHYKGSAFSINNSPTITPRKELPKGVRMGQRDALSSIDIIKLNIMYKCPLRCGADKFKCTDGSKCVSLFDKCNGVRDCNDGSDESDAAGCKPNCLSDQFACDSKCIPKSWLCDGFSDCSDRSDENPTNCRISCESYQFMCTSARKCISRWRLCDRRNDCPAGEDEANCAPPVVPTTTTTAKPFPTIYDPYQPTYPNTYQHTYRPPYQPAYNPCSANLYYQNYNYCYYQKRPALQYGQQCSNAYGAFVCDAIEEGLNIACNVPKEAITNPTRKMDMADLIRNEKCHFLIVNNAIPLDGSVGGEWVSNEPQVEAFIRQVSFDRTAYYEEQKRNDLEARKMEIYYTVGGPGAHYTILDIVTKGPKTLQAFVEGVRNKARYVLADGIVLDWRDIDGEKNGPDLLSVAKTFEVAIRTDPMKGPNMEELLWAITITDQFLLTANYEKVIKPLFQVADYINLVSAKNNAEVSFAQLNRVNEVFINLVNNGFPILTTEEKGKLLLAMYLGGRVYLNHTSAGDPKFLQPTLGPSQENSVKLTPGLVSYDEYCNNLRDEYVNLDEASFRVNGINFTERLSEKRNQRYTHILTWETQCTLSGKLKLFDSANGDNQFAGVFVADVSMDDVTGACDQNEKFPLMAVIKAKSKDRLDVYTGSCGQTTSELDDPFGDYF